MLADYWHLDMQALLLSHHEDTLFSLLWGVVLVLLLVYYLLIEPFRPKKTCCSNGCGCHD